MMVTVTIPVTTALAAIPPIPMSAVSKSMATVLFSSLAWK
jgi:hypothetical protein